MITRYNHRVYEFIYSGGGRCVCQVLIVSAVWLDRYIGIKLLYIDAEALKFLK